MVESDLDKLNSLRGSLKRHVTDKELHEVREQVFYEYLYRDSLK